ncbi:hypothetical protein Hanom_Chr03g00268081 [Helianthus anomalus]
MLLKTTQLVNLWTFSIHSGFKKRIFFILYKAKFWIQETHFLASVLQGDVASKKNSDPNYPFVNINSSYAK